MKALILDTAEDVTAHLPALKAQGCRTIGGYLSSIDPHGAKCLTPQRVRAIAAAGLRVLLVHEGWGGVHNKGISEIDGERDSRYCRQAAPTLGAPRGAAVYFACDTDFSAYDIRMRVVPYFKAVGAAFADGFYRVGVYGSGDVCAALAAVGLVSLTWEAQSRGWTGYSAWLKRATMVQGPATRIDGLGVDTDTAAGADIGDYVPFTDDAPPLAPESLGERVIDEIKKLV